MRHISRLARLTTKAAVLSLVPNVSLAVAATSDDLFNTYFANVLDGRPCFARTYEDKELAAHPDQRVRAIEIDLSKANADGTPNTPDRFQLGFALMLKSGPEWIGQTASCRTNDTDFECYVSGDGGVFSLTPKDGGELRLQTGDDGLALESSDKDIELGKDGGDSVFDLKPSKAECQAASAFFEGGSD
ncbi:hypothetical protein [Hyphomicrobium sp.]|uniref:hypothetical protein n=1 Tax=Hyphomicrobium sp. TaxID=82 RepID=UPI000F972888|nr:hypothetical protein [Hyphomicrobium sp.]RUO98988.1 MAG: hypothetical protein EKK30_09040 [Hyphomicrobium sp.]